MSVPQRYLPDLRTTPTTTPIIISTNPTGRVPIINQIYPPVPLPGVPHKAVAETTLRNYLLLVGDSE